MAAIRRRGHHLDHVGLATGGALGRPYSGSSGARQAARRRCAGLGAPGSHNQLFASFAKAIRVRVLASVVGRDGLTELDREYLEFADRFERELIHQRERRTLEESMEVGWQLLRRLPKSELARVSDLQIARYLQPSSGSETHA